MNLIIKILMMKNTFKGNTEFRGCSSGVEGLNSSISPWTVPTLGSHPKKKRKEKKNEVVGNFRPKGS